MTHKPRGLFAEANKTQQQSKNKPPQVIDALAKQIEKYQAKQTRRPPMMPSNAYAGAKWWLSVMESAHEYRDRVEPISRDGRIVAWKTPHHDRLLYTLNRFYSLSQPVQVWIVENMAKGIPWRGEKQAEYAAIIQIHAAMQKNPEKFKTNARGVASAFFQATREASKR